jgi:hypothetical protein
VGEPGEGTRRHHHDIRHIEASLHNSFMRRGGPIASNRHDRFSRRTWRNPTEAAAATTAVQPFRTRIANEEATLRQFKYATSPGRWCRPGPLADLNLACCDSPPRSWRSGCPMLVQKSSACPYGVRIGKFTTLCLSFIDRDIGDIMPLED